MIYLAVKGLITINTFLLEGMDFYLCIKEIANRFLVVFFFFLGGGGGGVCRFHTFPIIVKCWGKISMRRKLSIKKKTFN